MPPKTLPLNLLKRAQAAIEQQKLSAPVVEIQVKQQIQSHNEILQQADDISMKDGTSVQPSGSSNEDDIDMSSFTEFVPANQPLSFSFQPGDIKTERPQYSQQYQAPKITPSRFIKRKPKDIDTIINESSRSIQDLLSNLTGNELEIRLQKTNNQSSLSDVQFNILYNQIDRMASNKKLSFYTIYNKYSTDSSYRKIINKILENDIINETVEYQQKVHIKYISIGSLFKISSNNELSISQQEYNNQQIVEHVSEKVRTSFIIDNTRYDFTKTKFKNDKNEDDYNYDLEIEFIGKPQYSEIVNIIKYLFENVTNLYYNIISSVKLSNVFTVQPTNLSKIDVINPDFVRNMAVTIKLDGVRHNMIFYQGSILLISSMIRHLTPELIETTIKYVGSYNDSKLDNVLIEGEYYFNNKYINTTIQLEPRLNTITQVSMNEFHAFDILRGDSNMNNEIREYILYDRLNYIKSIFENINIDPSYTIFIKSFFFAKESYSIFDRANMCFNQNTNFGGRENDGLIFQYIGKYIDYNIQQANNKHPYLPKKWKPVEKITIDFRYVKVPTKSNEYNLMCSDFVPNKQFNKKEIIEKQFEYSDNKMRKYATYTDNTGEIKGNNLIIESSYKNGKFEPYKKDGQLVIRYDKQEPNKLFVCKSNLDQIYDNFNNNDITGVSSLGIRKVNNQIKNMLISNFAKGVLIDIGSGQGGDINKWNKQIELKKLRRVYAIEGDLNKISIFNERNIKNSDKIKLFEHNLTKDTINNIFENEVINANCITAFFCLTFFGESEESYNTLAELINTYIVNDGYFVAIFLDGRKVHELFEKEKIKINESYIQSSWSIERLYNEYNPFGCKIRSTINDSNVDNVEEYLFDYEYLRSKLIDFIEIDGLSNIKYDENISIIENVYNNELNSMIASGSVSNLIATILSESSNKQLELQRIVVLKRKKNEDIEEEEDEEEDIEEEDDEEEDEEDIEEDEIIEELEEQEDIIEENMEEQEENMEEQEENMEEQEENMEDDEKFNTEEGLDYERDFSDDDREEREEKLEGIKYMRFSEMKEPKPISLSPSELSVIKVEGSRLEVLGVRYNNLNIINAIQPILNIEVIDIFNSMIDLAEENFFKLNNGKTYGSIQRKLIEDTVGYSTVYTDDGIKYIVNIPEYKQKVFKTINGIDYSFDDYIKYESKRYFISYLKTSYLGEYSALELINLYIHKFINNNVSVIVTDLVRLDKTKESSMPDYNFENDFDREKNTKYYPTARFESKLILRKSYDNLLSEIKTNDLIVLCCVDGVTYFPINGVIKNGSKIYNHIMLQSTIVESQKDISIEQEPIRNIIKLKNSVFETLKLYTKEDEFNLILRKINIQDFFNVQSLSKFNSNNIVKDDDSDLIKKTKFKKLESSKLLETVIMLLDSKLESFKELPFETKITKLSKSLPFDIRSNIKYYERTNTTEYFNIINNQISFEKENMHTNCGRLFKINIRRFDIKKQKTINLDILVFKFEYKNKILYENIDFIKDDIVYINGRPKHIPDFRTVEPSLEEKKELAILYTLFNRIIKNRVITETINFMKVVAGDKNYDNIKHLKKIAGEEFWKYQFKYLTDTVSMLKFQKFNVQNGMHIWDVVENNRNKLIREYTYIIQQTEKYKLQYEFFKEMDERKKIPLNKKEEDERKKNLAHTFFSIKNNLIENITRFRHSDKYLKTGNKVILYANWDDNKKIYIVSETKGPEIKLATFKIGNYITSINFTNATIYETLNYLDFKTKEYDDERNKFFLKSMLSKLEEFKLTINENIRKNIDVIWAVGNENKGKWYDVSKLKSINATNYLPIGWNNMDIKSYEDINGNIIFSKLKYKGKINTISIFIKNLIDAYDPDKKLTLDQMKTIAINNRYTNEYLDQLKSVVSILNKQFEIEKSKKNIEKKEMSEINKVNLYHSTYDINIETKSKNKNVKVVITVPYEKEVVENTIRSIEELPIKFNALIGNEINTDKYRHTFEDLSFFNNDPRYIEIKNTLSDFRTMIKRSWAIEEKEEFDRIITKLAQIENKIGISQIYIPKHKFGKDQIPLIFDVTTKDIEITYSNLDIVPINFTPLINLKNLTLSHNMLTSFNNINCDSLTYLDLSNNKLTDESFNIDGTLKNIKILYLKNNLFKHAPQFKHLLKLDISNNQLIDLNLYNSHELVYIDASNNKIKNVDISNCYNLEYINVSHNHITELFNLSKNPKSIKVLNVSYNYISIIPVTIQELNESILKILYFDHNNLAAMFKEVTKNIINEKTHTISQIKNLYLKPEYNYNIFNMSKNFSKIVSLNGVNPDLIKNAKRKEISPIDNEIIEIENNMDIDEVIEIENNMDIDEVIEIKNPTPPPVVRKSRFDKRPKKSE